MFQAGESQFPLPAIEFPVRSAKFAVIPEQGIMDQDIDINR
jgi:hypothetical protein